MLKRTNRSASIRISIDHRGEIAVSAPGLMPKFLIDRFVLQNTAWIERQKHKIKLRQTANPSLDWEQKIVSYLGSLYSIEVNVDGGEKVEFTRGVCTIRPVTRLAEDGLKTLLNYLRMQAEIHISTRVGYWSKRMGTQYGTVRFGQQSSRWGSCSGDNNLRFNWRLIHFPKEVIDYVVIHELAHTVHHDHSDRFWDLVQQYCVTWKEQRRFLKRQAVMIEK